ncbi:MAG: glutamate racemase [Flavobacterium sp.]|nr:glutamate racemase [Flavobacterium sp.]
MTNSNPIGLFDSGVGGTSIWNEIYHLLPNEDYIYLADSKNAPYGEKTREEIIYLSSKNTELLLELNCKLIVVACNTATTNAIKELRAKYKVPFVGIEPAIKPAALHSKTQKIGILATKGTLNSELFYKNVEKFQDIVILEQIGYGLVELIESGKSESNEMNVLLQKYLTPMIEANIDYLVLGCSHYPYLIPQIKKILPSHIQIIDSGEAVAKQTKTLLANNIGFNAKSSIGNVIFYSNSNPKVLSDILNEKFEVHFRNF